MSRFVFNNILYTLKSSLVHDVKNQIFMHEVKNVKGNFIIKIQYKKINGLFVLYHTEVPIEHRGHDLGSLIAQEVFDYLTKHNIKTALYCPFLIKFKNKYSNEELNKIIQKLPANVENSFQ